MMFRLHRPAIRLILSIVLVTAVFAVGFHHHADGEHHADCPFCMAGGVFVSPSVPTWEAEAAAVTVSPVYLYKSIDTVEHSIFPAFAFRAPPPRPLSV